MDRREKLFEAIGDVGGDLILEAETRRFGPSALRRWGVLAAALAAAVGLTVLALPYLTDSAADSNPASQAVEVEQPDAADEAEQTDTADTEDTALKNDQTVGETDAADNVQSPSEDDDIEDDALEEVDSWVLNLPGYDDAKTLWEQGRSEQLLSSFVSTLELGCPDPAGSMLDFTDASQLSSSDLQKLFLLLLQQQKNNGWYQGPSYEERWFEPQEDLPEDSPYFLQGGWYDIPVGEFKTMLACWLTDFTLYPGALDTYQAEENVLRFNTISGLGGDVFLELTDAYFYDEEQMMYLVVNRYADAEHTQLEAIRYYSIQFDSGAARYDSIVRQN